MLIIPQNYKISSQLLKQPFNTILGSLLQLQSCKYVLFMKTLSSSSEVCRLKKCSITTSVSTSNANSDHFVNAPSQWGTTLHCNVVSHWQGTYTKWSLVTSGRLTSTYHLITAICMHVGGLEMFPIWGTFFMDYVINAPHCSQSTHPSTR